MFGDLAAFDAEHVKPGARVGLFGSMRSGVACTKATITRSPSAMVETSGVLTRGSIGLGFAIGEKYVTNAARPLGRFGLCWM